MINEKFQSYTLPKPPSLGGVPLNLTNPQNNDTLKLVSSTWQNVPQEDLVDGGNF